MKENSGVTTWKVTSIILLVLLVGSVYYFTSQPEVICDVCDICPERIEDKAILNVEIANYGLNEDNSQELLFNYLITNYGDVEAKNIDVTCKITNADYVTVLSVTDYYGNLASRTTEFGEILSKKTSAINLYDEYSAYCYIENCDDCEILYKRVPDLIESYEG